MNLSREKIVFWCLIAAEAAGSQAILWNGIPIYRRLLSPGTAGAGLQDFILVTLAVIVIPLYGIASLLYTIAVVAFKRPR